MTARLESPLESPPNSPVDAPPQHTPAPQTDHAHHANDAPEYSAAVRRVIDYFESLTPQSLDELAGIYSREAYFKDPFNEVQGLAAIRAVFAHMFAALGKPRFRVLGAVTQGNQSFLTWHFEFCFNAAADARVETIRGTTHLRFTPEGLVDVHRDYWDAAEELYEKLPLLGTLMRWLKKRARR